MLVGFLCIRRGSVTGHAYPRMGMMDNSLDSVYTVEYIIEVSALLN